MNLNLMMKKKEMKKKKKMKKKINEKTFEEIKDNLLSKGKKENVKKFEIIKSPFIPPIDFMNEKEKTEIKKIPKIVIGSVNLNTLKKMIEDVWSEMNKSPSPQYSSCADDFAIELCKKLGIIWIEDEEAEE